MSTFISATHGALVRSSEVNGSWKVETVYTGSQPHAIAAHPNDSLRFLAGTDSGIIESRDGGATWAPLAMQDRIIKSLAFNPQNPSIVYAGTKPAFMFMSQDGGTTWEELTGFRRIPGRWWWFSPAEKPFKAYVQQIAISPDDPNVVLAGIEFGAIVRSADGGQTWSGHRKGALRDCHSLQFHHSNGMYAYEGGGTGRGAAISRDGGLTWTRPKKNIRKGYGWACASDPHDPETWYGSVSSGPFKGHSLSGNSDSYLVRFKGDGGQVMNGGLPIVLPFMPYVILPSAKNAGTIYAAMSNGDIWQSANSGDDWQQLPVNAGDVLRTMLLVE